MSNLLTVVIGSHSDPELPATVQSIRETAGDLADIVIVDDCSSKPVHIVGAKVRRTQRRIGVGPARTLGAMLSETPWLLFVDAHMRFTPGWYQAASEVFSVNPATLWCGTCVGLNKDNMDVNKPSGVYYGATFNLCGPDHKHRHLKQVFEVVWAKPPEHLHFGQHGWEIPACMGASYLMNREWFLKLQPLRHLRCWGGDEAMLSIKTWLAGGEVRLLRDMRIGHKFRNDTRPPFRILPAEVLYNKLFAIHTLLPTDMAQLLIRHMRTQQGFEIANRMIVADWHLVEVERQFNAGIFLRDFRWLVDRFGLNMPSK